MKKIMILLFLLLASLSISAQSSDKLTAEFKARQQEQDDAENKKDLAALDKIFADDFIFIAANGSIHNKKQFLDELKADTEPPSDQKLGYEDFKVRVYGKTALANYVLMVPGKDKDGKATTSRFRMSVLWVKHGKNWRIVNFHATRVRP
jgi:ketosteroid isomerase-like protein